MFMEKFSNLIWGKKPNPHNLIASFAPTAGNIKFREILHSSSRNHDKGQTRSGRAHLVKSVIDAIQSLGGRFLQQDNQGESVSEICRNLLIFFHLRSPNI